ncbi:MAG: hypothetical protein SFW67_31070 [Myxococcaceae bacterium]|nr:hypothetical protein [Myxococcaceae bacterium]
MKRREVLADQLVVVLADEGLHLANAAAFAPGRLDLEPDQRPPHTISELDELVGEDEPPGGIVGEQLALLRVGQHLAAPSRGRLFDEAIAEPLGDERLEGLLGGLAALARNPALRSRGAGWPAANDYQVAFEGRAPEPRRGGLSHQPSLHVLEDTSRARPVQTRWNRLVVSKLIVRPCTRHCSSARPTRVRAGWWNAASR